MKEKYLNKLEYNKILKILEGFAITYLGKELVNSLVPFSSKQEVINSLTETTESNTLIFRKGNPPIAEIVDTCVHFKTLKSNSTLSAQYLLDLAHILKISRELREYFYADIDISFAKRLSRYFENLYTNIKIETTIFNSIIDEHTIDDKASSTLLNIRRNIKTTEQEIRQKLNSFMSSKYIQEAVITIRNNRYVVPVKSEYKSEVKGFVHDISASGLTFFIEPISVFELNNKLSSLKIEENIEIEKILQKLSSLFFDIIDELENNISIIGKIDFIFAKGKYGISINGIEPIINDNKFIDFKKARHPLIDTNKVVPIDISIGKDFSTLVVTGPNTGGKTVTLKTVGLLLLMAMSGLYIPANSGSSIYVFDNIFADIGDEQSIADSLSTFSSHMLNIIEILNCITPNSLVLLDELGSGTDPIEGASLAISILEYLYNKKVLTLSTTHYSEIKNYAIVTDGFENASSEFDVEKLQPTYKLLIGVPGKSNAFAISKRLGLSPEILEKAKSLVNTSQISVEELIKNIYDDKILIEKEKEKILKNSLEIETLKSSLNQDLSSLEDKKIELVNSAKQEARDILLEAKEEVNEAILKIQSSKDSKELNNIRAEMNSKIKELNPTILDNTPSTLSKGDITLGMEVYIPSLNQNGIVLSLPNNSNQMQVQVGNAKMNFNLNKLEGVKNKSVNTTNTKILKSNTINKASSVSSEINVIGYNVEEATFTIDKYLDDCILANIPSVRIVHGKGTGTLRNGIHQFLKKNSHVKSFRIGVYGEGEMGVTIVELK